MVTLHKPYADNTPPHKDKHKKGSRMNEETRQQNGAPAKWSAGILPATYSASISDAPPK